MKKAIYLLIILITVTTQAQTIQWQKTFGGMHADYLYDAIPTLDYGFIMVGGSLSNNTGNVDNNAGDFDFFITKVSEFGKLEWTNTLGGHKTDILKSITNSSGGGYLLAGISNSKKTETKTSLAIGQQDIWLVKIDINGAVEWQKTLGGLADENVNSILKTKDGGYIIAGSSASDDYVSSDPIFLKNEHLILKSQPSRGNLDYWMIKIDAHGKAMWQQTYGGKYKDELSQIIELPNGGFVLAGTSNSPMGMDKKTPNNGVADWWIIKTDRLGNSQWQKTMGNDGNDQLNSLLLSNDGNILLGGSFGLGNTSDMQVIKMDLTGEIIWENNLTQGDIDILTNMVQNKDGSLLVSGYTTTHETSNSGKSNRMKAKPETNTEDYLVIKLAENGEELWRKNIGTDKKEVLKKSIKTRDGGYVLMGSAMPHIANGTNNANFYIVKLKDNDKQEVEKLPLEAIPNPTNNYTKIVIGTAYQEGTLTVVNVNGSVLFKKKIHGERIIPLQLSHYANGVYFIHVDTNQLDNSIKVLKISN